MGICERHPKAEFHAPVAGPIQIAAGGKRKKRAAVLTLKPTVSVAVKVTVM